eukprot:gb/GECG01007413.1/.p1 GENE.gb/GECG01007413.1/~~gb/GECG01007413.1/.p1  ORF type:complete len:400 (+),score=44.55 gb/GECG01007413.1/:1-1200(+)
MSAGVNTTDPLARSVHGTNPQNLVEKILRVRIHNSFYWKAHCFALTAETLLEKAVQLQYIGSTYGGNHKPTPFICLTLKLLQIQPDQDIVLEYIKQEDYKYVRALGAFYLRLVGRPKDIYQYLEPLYNDYRKLRMRTPEGWILTHMDEFIDDLLHKETVLGIALPRLPKRHQLEDAGYLKPRVSALQDEFESMEKAGLLDKSKSSANGTQTDQTTGNKEDSGPENHKEEENSKQDESRKATGGTSERRLGNEQNAEHTRSRSRSRDRSESRRGDSRSHRDRKRHSRNGQRRSRSHRKSRSRSRSRSRSDDRRKRHSRRRRNSRSDSENSHDSERRRQSRSPEPKQRHKHKERKRKNDEPTRPETDASKSPAEAAKSVAPEGSTEYWNEMRKRMGMKPLK